jgi:hypothetical protein
MCLVFSGDGREMAVNTVNRDLSRPVISVSGHTLDNPNYALQGEKVKEQELVALKAMACISYSSYSAFISLYFFSSIELAWERERERERDGYIHNSFKSGEWWWSWIERTWERKSFSSRLAHSPLFQFSYMKTVH